MTGHLNWTAAAVFLLFLVLVMAMGFLSAHWKKGDLESLEDWGLGGRRFGTLTTWFLLGGDFYTAYTIIAVPAYIFGAGAIGFFAMPYTILVYPFFFLAMPKLWLVAKRHNYTTAADFVLGRYGSRSLALLIAVVGILATEPYIALQLVGMQVAIRGLGLQGTGFVNDLPLVSAVLLLAAFSYTSGLRAPASIAFVKDTMVYVFVLAAVVWVPLKFGGFERVFHVAANVLGQRAPTQTLVLSPAEYLPYASLALGSSLAAFLYPHTVTGVLSSSSAQAIRRNAVLLPIYTLLLGFLALLGYMAVAAGVKVSSTNDVLPSLLTRVFPSWFVGFCFAAIAVGALVPAAVMAISAANLFTRNIYCEFFRPKAGSREQSGVAKAITILIVAAALIFVLFGRVSYAVAQQLLAGVWILQTFPTVAIGLFTRWFDPKALWVGCAAGICSGTAMVWSQGLTSAIYTLHIRQAGLSLASYAAVDALVLNLSCCVILTIVFKAIGIYDGADATVRVDLYGHVMSSSE